MKNKNNNKNDDKKERNISASIQNISIKICDIARILIIIAAIIIMTVISIKAFYKTGYFPSTYDNAIEKTDYKYDNILENLAYIILFLVIIYLLNKLLMKIKLKYVIPIGLVCVFIIFVWFVVTLDLVPIADQGQIMILADAVSNNIINLHVNPGSYLEMFPYQFGFAYYVGIVIKIINLTQNIFGLDSYIYLQILNAVYSIICMVLMYLIGNRLLKENKRAKNILIILTIFFGVYFMFFNTHVYGNLPGLIFGLFAFLCTIRFVQEGKWYNLILSGISIFIAIYLKTNYQIFLIAILGVLGMELLRKIEIKKFVSILVILMVYMISSSFGDWLIEKNIGRVIPAGVPMITYMYMGWAPSNTLSSGWYTGDVINIYTENEFDHINTAEETKKLFLDRIEHFKNDTKEFIRYAWDKFDSTWLNPTFQTIWLATPGSDRIGGNVEYKEYIENNSWIIEMVNYKSDVFHIEERLFDAYEIIVFVSAIIGVIYLLKNENKESENLLLVVTFLGGVAFHFVLWETKAIYVLGYFYLLLPYTSKGLEILFTKLEEMFKNIKDKIKEKRM